MNDILNPIIPVNQIFYNSSTQKVVQWEKNGDMDLDYHAIAVFLSMGFMLDDKTFYQDIKVCKPATKYLLNDNNIIVEKDNYWQWHYNPSDSSFSQILEEFIVLFERLVLNNIKSKRILLPISGGLDSRTLFVAVQNRSDITLSSYEFEDGFPELGTGLELSEYFNIPLYTQKIPMGYLWNKLDELCQLNNCFSDFVHPRQMAAIQQWKGLGDVLLLGHWGDVLFDNHINSNYLSYDEQLMQLKMKVLKPGGIELAECLWNYWGLAGSFDTYITDRLNKLYSGINIDHPSARIRAFKSLYWAPRWTSINLSIFRQAGEIVLPYYSDEMCKFICTIPERFLKGRKIQIEYIKKKCPKAAIIPWQKYQPLNLYQYQWFNHPLYYPFRIVRKVKRLIQKKLSNSPELITRNWELQFLGKNNLFQLKYCLLKQNKFNEIIPKQIIKKYIEKFQENPVKYAHPLSMLITLEAFSGKSNQ